MAAVINIEAARPGAAPEEWQHFDLVLGLTADLLPVVSNSKAVISPHSKMAALGKTPSRYNPARQAVGFPEWTQHHATPEDIATWSRERDLGICVQTRAVRALDVDIDDPELAQRVREWIDARVALPARVRAGAAKFLLAFELPGDYTKRRVRCATGMVEFLATGQQFVAVGTHPSGSRYEWEGGLPEQFPVLTPSEFEALWHDLAHEFGVEAPTELSASTKAQRLSEAAQNDPVAVYLMHKGFVHRTDRDGKLHITCPWESEHTGGEAGDTSTTYWPAHTGGFAEGHFRCLHAHCEHRTDQQFRDAIGFVDVSMAGEFTAIGEPEGEGKPKLPRFHVYQAAQFADGPPLTWLIRDVLPRAELAVLYGEPGSGKSFLALDMAIAIARGEPWRGKKVKAGRVVYVAAEGARGFRKRLHALAQDRGIDLASIPLGVISDAPDLMQKADALAIAQSIVDAGGADLVVIDTLSRAMPGANENSGEDVGKVLVHCKGIGIATRGVVMLVHHSGKDASKGARGWSGIRGAADTELEVVRADEARSVTVGKQKDGDDGDEFAFRLETVVLGLDDEGEEITSCVVRHTDEKPVRKAARGPAGSIERLVLEAMRDAVGLGSEWVEVLDIKAKAKEQMPFDPAEGRRDTRGQRLDRAIESLRDAGRLVVEGTKLAFGAGNPQNFAG